MSFVEQQDVFDTIQPVLQGVFEEFGGGRKVDAEWPQISYRDAAFGMAPTSPTCATRSRWRSCPSISRVPALRSLPRLLEQDGTEIRAIPAPRAAVRKFCDRMNAFAQKEGLPGMGYIFWRDQGEGMEAAGPLAKNIGPERTEAIRQQLGLEVGDAAFFLGGKAKAFETVAARRAMCIGEELKLTEKDRFAFAWVVDFPIYEQDEETGEDRF